MALRRAFDAVRPVQAGVEPLRAVRRRHLGGQHVARFIAEGEGVGFAGEITGLPAPVGPATGEAAKDLASVGFARHTAAGRWPAALQPEGNAGLGDLLDRHGNGGPAEVFLGQNVHGNLRPGLRDLDVLHLENDGPIRVYDARVARRELDGRERILAGIGEATGNVHGIVP